MQEEETYASCDSRSEERYIILAYEFSLPVNPIIQKFKIS